MIPVPKEAFGKFYEGDAYIVYNSSKNEFRSRLETHIHFWIGEKASQDEYTVAAVKSIELDDLLGGGPIQHREVQGYESGQFKSYFKNGMHLKENRMRKLGKKIKIEFIFRIVLPAQKRTRG